MTIKSQQDFRQEYEQIKNRIQGSNDWKFLDKFFDELIEMVPQKTAPLKKWAQYAFDSEGTPIPHPDDFYSLK